MEFTETQRLNLTWLYALLAIEALIIGVILFGGNYISWQEIEKAYFLPVFALLAPLLIVPVIRNMKMVYRLNSEGIWYKASFLISRQRTFSWSEIKSAYVRKFDALGEYGGWGIKHRLWFKRNDKAYIFNQENRGLQLELKDGRKLLFSTGKAAELELFLINLKTRYGIKEIVDHA
jgi:hypothetical protein